jgi:hypothetical protein
MLNRSEITMEMRFPTPPPKAPCTARPTISMVMSIDRAHTIELQKNPATTQSRMALRPQMSDSMAQMGAKEALPNRYAPPIYA